MVRLHTRIAPAVVAVLAALPVEAPAAPALHVTACQDVPAGALVEALRLRLDGDVALRHDGLPGPDDWTLAVASAPHGARLTLRAPDGRTWERQVDLPRRADGPERARAVALQAAYVASLAGAPFAAGDLPPGPEGAVEPGSPPPAAETAFLVEVALDGTGDLWGEARGEDVGMAVSFRPAIVWSWGLWLELETGWERLFPAAQSDVTLDLAPLRLGIGFSIPLGSWLIRAALQAVAEYWAVSGEARAADGWRAGAGLLGVGGYRVADCCTVGLEAGLDYLPKAIEILYRDEPLFALGQIRWRAGLWAGFRLGAL